VRLAALDLWEISEVDLGVPGSESVIQRILGFHIIHGFSLSLTFCIYSVEFVILGAHEFLNVLIHGMTYLDDVAFRTCLDSAFYELGIGIGASSVTLPAITARTYLPPLASNTC